MMMEYYKRENSVLARSLAYYQFKRDFTTVNDYYWGVGSSLQAVSGRVRHMSATDDFHVLLGLTQERYEKPLGHSSDKYAAQLSVSMRWHRLLTLVIMTSAFERYITAVARTAVSSDPVLSLGFPKKVDGLTLAKYSLEAGDRPTEPLTKGEWSSRLAAFRRYFREVPRDLQSNEGELEQMRNRRNQIAHAFALDAAPSMSAHEAVLLGARRTALPDLENVAISEQTIKKWMAVIDSCAFAIDAYLLPNFIGGYEVAAICLEWIRDKDSLYRKTGIKVNSRGTSDAKKFSKFLGVLLEYPIQHEMAQTIIDYVDQL
jgi:hypothetical protein